MMYKKLYFNEEAVAALIDKINSVLRKVPHDDAVVFRYYGVAICAVTFGDRATLTMPPVSLNTIRWCFTGREMTVDAGDTAGKYRMAMELGKSIDAFNEQAEKLADENEVDDTPLRELYNGDISLNSATYRSAAIAARMDGDTSVSATNAYQHGKWHRVLADQDGVVTLCYPKDSGTYRCHLDDGTETDMYYAKSFSVSCMGEWKSKLGLTVVAWWKPVVSDIPPYTDD